MVTRNCVITIINVFIYAEGYGSTGENAIKCGVDTRKRWQHNFAESNHVSDRTAVQFRLPLKCVQCRDLHRVTKHLIKHACLYLIAPFTGGSSNVRITANEVWVRKRRPQSSETVEGGANRRLGAF